MRGPDADATAARVTEALAARLASLAKVRHGR
jgi:hypothetical protein